MRPREAAAARGEVFFRGRWVRWSDQESTLAAELKARQEAEIARRKLLEQRAADAALAAAEAQPQPVYTYGTYQAVPRVLYWSPYTYGYRQCGQNGAGGNGVIIHASGHTGSGNWSLDWHW
jgi:hypothetical protein